VVEDFSVLLDTRRGTIGPISFFKNYFDFGRELAGLHSGHSYKNVMLKALTFLFVFWETHVPKLGKTSTR
jgi:hypothetical protein